MAAVAILPAGLLLLTLVGCGPVASHESAAGPRRKTAKVRHDRVVVSASAGKPRPHAAQPSAAAGTADVSPTIARLVAARGRFTDDPAKDGWDTEVFAKRANEQLKQIANRLASADDSAAEVLGAILSDGFTCTELRPSARTVVYQDRTLRIEEGPRKGVGAADGLPPTHHGRAGLIDAIRAHRQPLAAARQVHAKFKIVRVERQSPAMVTTALLEVWGMTERGAVQQDAVWTCRWLRSGPGKLPRLDRIGVEDYQEVVAATTAGTLFRECTPSVMGQSRSYGEQLLLGNRYWAERVEARLGADFMGNCGLAIGDVNGDGREDLYVCQPGGLPNLLLVHNADGTVTDQSRGSGVDFLDSTKSALLIDLNNDGHQDLVVATITRLVILSNDGSGKFTPRADIPRAARAYSLSAADYDGDGDLDLYACLYHPPANAPVGNPLPYDDANNGPANVLVRNEGDWRFRDATRDSGLDENNRRWSYAAAWEDYDNDGDPDLYVANDYGRNCLYQNVGGRFHDVASKAGVEDIASGMSVSWGDYNGDGRMDLYVGNMFSSAGGRVTFQRNFKADASSEKKQHLQRLARGNTLFRNRGDGSFDDVSEAAGVTMGRWAWSSEFVDINNDGWEDIVVVNGHVTGDPVGDL